MALTHQVFKQLDSEMEAFIQKFIGEDVRGKQKKAGSELRTGSPFHHDER